MTVTKRHNFTLFFNVTYCTKTKRIKKCSCSRALLDFLNRHTEIVTHNTLPVCLQLRQQFYSYVFFIVLSEILVVFFFLFSLFSFLFAFYLSPVILFTIPLKDVYKCAPKWQQMKYREKKNQNEIRQKRRHQCE